MSKKFSNARGRIKNMKLILAVLLENHIKVSDLLNSRKPLEPFFAGLTDEDLIRLTELNEGEIYQGFKPVIGYEHITKIIGEN